MFLYRKIKGGDPWSIAKLKWGVVSTSSSGRCRRGVQGREKCGMVGLLGMFDVELQVSVVLEGAALGRHGPHGVLTTCIYSGLQPPGPETLVLGLLDNILTV